MPVIQFVLTPSEAKVLGGVRVSGGVSVPELSANARTRPAELRVILKRLGDKGLISIKEPDESKGRLVKLVKLTEAGTRVQSLVRPKRKRGYSRYLAGPYSFFRRQPVERVLILPNDADVVAASETDADLDSAIMQAAQTADQR